MLAIDPSSKRTGGSILGDKTRMDKLSYEPNAFIRPTPSRGVLGGVALETSSVTLLFENCGYKSIVVESVGVGQSEIEIDNVVDFVVYVVPPGAGDGLQGAKKGIMEVADLIVVNKYDGDFKPVCKRVKRVIESSLSLSFRKHPEWQVPVELVSAQENFNLETIWTHAHLFKQTLGEQKIQDRRLSQMREGMWSYLSHILMHRLRHGAQDHTHPVTATVHEVEH